MDIMFNVTFFLFFILVFGMIVYTIIQNISEWDRNNKSPKLSVEAKIVDKRSKTTHHHHNNGGHHHTTRSTCHYITFEFQNGERTELRVPSDEYGLLVAGDVGTLSFQGTRYLGFKRKINFDTQGE